MIANVCESFIFTQTEKKADVSPPWRTPIEVSQRWDTVPLQSTTLRVSEEMYLKKLIMECGMPLSLFFPEVTHG